MRTFDVGALRTQPAPQLESTLRAAAKYLSDTSAT
jgi:hypothetical protein